MKAPTVSVRTQRSIHQPQAPTWCAREPLLLWERRLDVDLAALTANMLAWDRWCASVVTDGHGRVHPVAHLTLRGEAWITDEIAPALVDGRPLSHPQHDPIPPVEPADAPGLCHDNVAFLLRRD